MSNQEIAEVHFELLMQCSPAMIRAAVRTFYPLTATTLLDEHLLAYLQDRKEELQRRVVETLDHLDQTRLNVVCPRPELLER